MVPTPALAAWGCAHACQGVEVDDARAHHVAKRVILSLDDKHGRTRHLGVNYDLHLRSVVVGHPPAVEVIRLIHAGAAPLGARGRCRVLVGACRCRVGLWIHRAWEGIVADVVLRAS